MTKYLEENGAHLMKVAVDTVLQRMASGNFGGPPAPPKP